MIKMINNVNTLVQSIYTSRPSCIYFIYTNVDINNVLVSSNELFKRKDETLFDIFPIR